VGAVLFKKKTGNPLRACGRQPNPADRFYAWFARE